MRKTEPQRTQGTSGIRRTINYINSSKPNQVAAHNKNHFSFLQRQIANPEVRASDVNEKCKRILPGVERPT